MKNTLENKQKFFALYWGQRLISYPESFGGLRIVEGSHVCEKTFLLLKPLSKISDDDDLVIKEKLNIYHSSNLLDAIINNTTYVVNIQQTLKAIDFLRSKGYALPFMGVSVETLIEWGWIKLEEI